MRIVEFLASKLVGPLLTKWNKSEYTKQKFRWINERPIELRYVFEQLTKINPKTVLDAGTGKSALPRILSNCGFIVTAIDNIYDYWPKGMINRHFHVIQDDIKNPKIKKRFDFITCISVLEHIPDHQKAVAGLTSLLKDDGFIVFTFPYNENEYVYNVYEHPESSYGQNASYICQVFSRNELNSWCRDTKCEIIDQEYWEIFEGAFWTFGERLVPPVKVSLSDKHHLSCVLIQKKSKIQNF